MTVSNQEMSKIMNMACLMMHSICIIIARNSGNQFGKLDLPFIEDVAKSHLSTFCHWKTKLKMLGGFRQKKLNIIIKEKQSLTQT